MAPSNVGFRWQSGLTADVSPMSANDPKRTWAGAGNGPEVFPVGLVSPISSFDDLDHRDGARGQLAVARCALAVRRWRECVGARMRRRARPERPVPGWPERHASQSARPTGRARPGRQIDRDCWPAARARWSAAPSTALGPCAEPPHRLRLAQDHRFRALARQRARCLAAEARCHTRQSLRALSRGQDSARGNLSWLRTS